MRRNLFTSAAAVAAMIVAGGVQAQQVEGQIGFASEYVGKGLGKSAGDPSAFASAEVGQGDFYASVFVSTAKLSQGSDAEIVSVVGYRPSAAGFDFDLSVVNRDLPGTRVGIDANYWEYQADASRRFGPVKGRFRVNYTPDGFAATREAWWIEAQASMSLDDKTKLSAAVADRTAEGGAEYAAWNIGAKRELTDRVALDVRWYDTDSHALGDNYDGRLVGALSFSF